MNLRTALLTLGVGGAVMGGMIVASTVVLGEPHLWALGEWRPVSVADFAGYPAMTAFAILAGLGVGAARAGS